MMEQAHVDLDSQPAECMVPIGNTDGMRLGSLGYADDTKAVSLSCASGCTDVVAAWSRCWRQRLSLGPAKTAVMTINPAPGKPE
jgi:hypothetical protein